VYADLQDVEGFEPAVVSTASQLLDTGAIDNLIMEYTPGVLERAARCVWPYTLVWLQAGVCVAAHYLVYQTSAYTGPHRFNTAAPAFVIMF
jgi:hypothetical protein